MIDTNLQENLHSKWEYLTHKLAIPTIESKTIFQDLIKRYSEEHRAYHNLNHIFQCYRELYKNYTYALWLAEDPELLQLALWYHDAIYDTHAKDNEMQSSKLATDSLGSILGTDKTTKLQNLIMATKHTSLPVTLDEKILVDVDLSILGQEPDLFDKYETQIREEYHWVPDDIFKSKRQEILQNFLDRPQIYLSEAFLRLEIMARSNLTRSLAKLIVN